MNTLQNKNQLRQLLLSVLRNLTMKELQQKLSISATKLNKLMDSQELDFETARKLEAATNVKTNIWLLFSKGRGFNPVEIPNTDVIINPYLCPYWDYSKQQTEYNTLTKDCGYGTWKPSIPDGVNMTQSYLTDKQIQRKLKSEYFRLLKWSGIKTTQMAKILSENYYKMVDLERTGLMILSNLRNIVENGFGGTLILNILVDNKMFNKELQIVSFTSEQDKQIGEKLAQIRKSLCISKYTAAAVLNKTPQYIEKVESSEIVLSLPKLVDYITKCFGGHISLNIILLNELENNILNNLTNYDKIKRCPKLFSNSYCRV